MHTRDLTNVLLVFFMLRIVSRWSSIKTAKCTGYRDYGTIESAVSNNASYKFIAPKRHLDIRVIAAVVKLISRSKVCLWCFLVLSSPKSKARSLKK